MCVILDEIIKNADPVYKDFQGKLLPTVQSELILGLRAPRACAIAKKYSNTEAGNSFLKSLPHKYYDENIVHAFMLGNLKCPKDELLAKIIAFLPYMDNWAVCDSFCCNAKWAQKMPVQDLWTYLFSYFHSKKEFEVRFAIVMSMCYLMNEEWLPTVFHQLEAIQLSEVVSEYDLPHSPYYVRMGMAWLLATALAKYPDATRAFMNRTSLPEDVKRLYVRKARESFRTRNVSPY